MIPTYNCNDLLEQTLRCVLDQDPGRRPDADRRVDDGRPMGDRGRSSRSSPPAASSSSSSRRTSGWRRTGTHASRGARGHWVHILHQDDLIRRDSTSGWSGGEAAPESAPPSVATLTSTAKGDGQARPSRGRRPASSRGGSTRISRRAANPVPVDRREERGLRGARRVSAVTCGSRSTGRCGRGSRSTIPSGTSPRSWPAAGPRGE